MTATDRRRYEMLKRVQDFGRKHKEQFPEASVGGGAFKAVDAAVEQLGVHTVAKITLAEEGKVAKTMAREKVELALEEIERTARLIARTQPEVGSKFKLTRQKSATALLTMARAFAQEAEAASAVFVAHGLADG